jgi:putative methionine-R-sulfoxide reductase with GAF domain
MKPALKLSDIPRCFQGVTPSLMATCDARGVPNITYLSQVHYLDDGHVALSCQFFNKTRRNLDENPLACVEMYDPLTLQAYRLRLKFLRSEKTGPLFDAMSARIEAIASATGMKGIFRLIAADVFEVLSLHRLEGYLTASLSSNDADAPSLEGYRSEVRGLQWVSERINRSNDLESLLGVALEALEEFFQFSHTSVLIYDEACDKLITLASRGYEATGIGAEVPVGEGIIGTAARDRQVLRFSRLDSALGYGRAIRREMSGEDRRDEIALPGLPDARSVLVIPLTVGRRLVGVLSAEDPDPMRFGDWHEAYLQIIGNQIALGIDRLTDRAEEGELGATGLSRRSGEAAKADARGQRGAPPAAAARKKRTLIYYRKDEAIFVDGEYLIRNIPARILWKLLDESQRTGRTEFTNREVRLDESLGLPPVKDNFESRLILLRHRLKEKCPDLQIVAIGRGRFALQAAAAIEMIER